MTYTKVTRCNLCTGKVALVENKAVYGRNRGWPWIWQCQESGCRAYVGCHTNTYKPLGLLADRRTRTARKAAYASLEAYCNRMGIPHSNMAGWVAKQLNVSVSRSGIGWLDINQCRQLIELCSQNKSEDLRLKGLTQLAMLREKYFPTGAQSELLRGGSHY